MSAFCCVSGTVGFSPNSGPHKGRVGCAGDKSDISSAWVLDAVSTPSASGKFSGDPVGFVLCMGCFADD